MSFSSKKNGTVSQWPTVPLLWWTQSYGLAHPDRLEALRAPARLRAAAFATMRALQRLLTAIVLAGALLSVGPPRRLLTHGSGLRRVMALALPMTLLAWLGTVRVLAMPVRPAMAAAGVMPSIRSMRIAAMGMLTRLSTP